jgi:nucleoid-associated protein YgaU
MSEAVGYRNIKVNAKYIRGYGVPKYASKATAEPAPVTPSAPATGSAEYKVGDVVQFTGCLHYTSSYASGVAKACKAGLATVNAISKGKPHPYQLRAVAGKGSTVCGWVNASDIASKATSTKVKTHKVVKGDTLSKIAKQYDTTVDILVKLNGIKNKNLLSVGQIIKLP